MGDDRCWRDLVLQNHVIAYAAADQDLQRTVSADDLDPLMPQAKSASSEILCLEVHSLASFRIAQFFLNNDRAGPHDNQDKYQEPQSLVPAARADEQMRTEIDQDRKLCLRGEVSHHQSNAGGRHSHEYDPPTGTRQQGLVSQNEAYDHCVGAGVHRLASGLSVNSIRYLEGCEAIDAAHRKRRADQSPAQSKEYRSRCKPKNELKWQPIPVGKKQDTGKERAGKSQALRGIRTLTNKCRRNQPA